MLRAWVGPLWSLFGGGVMIIQYGLFSYWSQSYWGGMVPALGGALVFGAARRLWKRLSAINALWLSLGCIVLANSRPVEGLVATSPALALIGYRVITSRPSHIVLAKTLVPSAILIGCAAIAMGYYNYRVTGSVWYTPYALHEAQYQESPPFYFMERRPVIEYSNKWLVLYYVDVETGRYGLRSDVSLWIRYVHTSVRAWWAFYVGGIWSVAMCLAVIRRGGLLGQLQILVAVTLLSLGALEDTVLTSALSVAAMACQLAIAVCALDYWSRFAVGAIALLLAETLLLKWHFPHYFAPAASLLLFLQVLCVRQLWQSRRWAAGGGKDVSGLQAGRDCAGRWIVGAVTVAAVFNLGTRVVGRVNGSTVPGIESFDSMFLPTSDQDWSLRRAGMQRWLQEQSQRQLVFVKYSDAHAVTQEWVYNEADIEQAHIVWARDLGDERNGELLRALPGRIVWVVQADRNDAQLIPYARTTAQQKP